MFVKSSGMVLALFSLLFAAGCSSRGGTSNFFPPAGDNSIRIESEPAGAEVYVMGENIGVTPLQISRNDVFPNNYPGEKLSLYGTVTLKKEGCSDLTRTVSTEISSKGLRAKLDCADMNPASPPALLPATSSPRAPAGETVEQRLDKIRDLLNKGLITGEEAKKTRERILKDL